MMREEEERGMNRCQDCGNQAKKECQNMRCRTCCKSRGFECQTHVKSTWVPVGRRRPRHHVMHQIPPLHGNPKRYKQISQLGLQEGNLPGETCLPAVFRCVRVSSMDNVVDQYAYQTSVSIGGHTFTGILYDQGPSASERTGHFVTGETSSAGAAGLLQQQANFVTRTTGTTPFLAFTTTTNSQFFQYPKS